MYIHIYVCALSIVQNQENPLSRTQRIDTTTINAVTFNDGAC